MFVFIKVIAHNLFHLLAEGKAILTTGLALIGIESHGGSAAIVDMLTIQILQFALLGLGGFASAYTAYRIARVGDLSGGIKSSIPFVVLITIFVAFNLYLFLLPMAHRM